MNAKRDAKIDLLSGVDLFRGCSRKELTRIGSLTTETTAAPGKVLCVEGQVGFDAFVVLDGKAAVSKGGQEVLTIGPGGFFGEMALLDGGPRIATVTAVTPLQVLVLTRREFHAVLSEVPAVATAMLVTLAGRLRAMEHALRAAGLPTGV